MFLKIDNIHKTFGNNHVLKGISTKLDRGEVMSIIGPSGSGKSTFLKCLNFLEYPDKGSIILNGSSIGFDENGKIMSERIIHQQRKSFGMVFQNFNLFWHMNLLENIIEAPMRVLKKSRKEAETTYEKARNLLIEFGGKGLRKVQTELLHSAIIYNVELLANVNRSAALEWLALGQDLFRGEPEFEAVRRSIGG